MGQLIGYARVSTADQNPELQLDELKEVGCPRVFKETATGAKTDRPQLEKCLDHLRDGDTLVVWKLDRLGRSLKHLIATIHDLQERGVAFRSLKENIDTRTPSGKLIFHIFGSLSEFERDLIRERTAAGIRAARARGRKGGRPKLLSPEKAKLAQQLYDSREHQIDDILKILGIGRTTFYQYIVTDNRKEEEQLGRMRNSSSSLLDNYRHVKLDNNRKQ